MVFKMYVHAYTQINRRQAGLLCQIRVSWTQELERMPERSLCKMLSAQFI